MTITMPEVAETRALMLAAYREALVALIGDATQAPGDVRDEDGELSMVLADWDGVPVVTRKRLDQAINAIFSQPIPAPSETTVEVTTPATVLVSAVCPRCGIAQLIGMSVHPELLIDDEGSELRVKSKAKGRTHLCGQLPLVEQAVEAGDEQIGLLMEIESLVERVHAKLQEVAALTSEEGGEEMPTIETIRLWDRATIDQVDRWATACLAGGEDPYGEVPPLPPLPRVLGGETDPEPVNEAGDAPICRVCGCTDEDACDPPCSWFSDDLCSACVPDLVAGPEDETPESAQNGDDDDDLLPGEPDAKS